MEVLDLCGILIKKIHDALEKKTNNELRTKDLTLAQVQMLMTLEKEENGISSLKKLEKILNVAQSTTVGIVKRLEPKGFVEGYMDSEDKRIKLVRITPAGKAVCHEAQADMNENEQRLLSGLTKSEREQLKVLLQKVYKNLK